MKQQDDAEWRVERNRMIDWDMLMKIMKRVDNFQRRVQIVTSLTRRERLLLLS